MTEEIRLQVDALSGHHGFPGPAEVMTTRKTTHVPFRSTVPGFLESMCGDEPGAFTGLVAYGRVRPPRGIGKVLKSDYVAKPLKGPESFTLRPTFWEILIQPSYQIAVRGEYVPRIREALAGKLPRYGILTLGTSDDEVFNLVEQATEAQWVVPGTSFPLIVYAPRGYSNRSARYERFDLTPLKLEVPEEAWYTPERV